MQGSLTSFQDELLSEQPEQAFSQSDDPQFFGVPINRGVLKALNFPVKAIAQPSSVKVIPGKDKNVTKDLLLIDPEIAHQWNELPQNILVTPR